MFYFILILYLNATGCRLLKLLIRSVIQTNQTTIYSSTNHWCATTKILLRQLHFLTLKILNIIIFTVNLLYEELR